MVSLKVLVGGLIIAIIGLVVAMEVIGETVDDIESAANTTTDEYRCDNSGCFWNDTRTTDCTANNRTGGDAVACSNNDYNEGTPLQGLFSPAGIIILLVLAASLMLVLKLALRKHA